MHSVVLTLKSCEEEINKTYQDLVKHFENTVSDQAAVNGMFNSELEKLRAEILRETFPDFDLLPVLQQQRLIKMGNFFCKMHLLVNFAAEDNIIISGKNPHAMGFDAGTVRLIMETAKALSEKGDDKSGVGDYFEQFLLQGGKVNRIQSFRGHRFNQVFHAAAVLYYHKQDIVDFLKIWPDPNGLLKSIKFDIYQTVYIAGIKALAIIDKIITGPLWIIIEALQCQLEVNTHLHQLQLSLGSFMKDGKDLIEGNPIFHEDTIVKDNVYHIVFGDTNDTDLHSLTITALELLSAHLLIVFERQSKDQLPGGKYWDLKDTEQFNNVPPNNTDSEQDMGILDVLVRTKPSATIDTISTMTVWARNKPRSSFTETLKAKVQNTCIRNRVMATLSLVVK